MAYCFLLLAKEHRFVLLFLHCNRFRLHGSVKIKTDDECNVCKEQQAIKHLLWDCPYVKSLWKTVEDVCGIKIYFVKILGTEDCNGYDNVFTLISF